MIHRKVRNSAHSQTSFNKKAHIDVKSWKVKVLINTYKVQLDGYVDDDVTINPRVKDSQRKIIVIIVILNSIALSHTASSLVRQCHRHPIVYSTPLIGIVITIMTLRRYNQHCSSGKQVVEEFGLRLLLESFDSNNIISLSLLLCKCLERKVKSAQN